MDAFLAAQSRMDAIKGQAFNIGGGPSRTISLVELIARIEELQGRKPEVRFSGWRPGDEKYYVSDTRAGSTRRPDGLPRGRRGGRNRSTP